MNDIFTLKKFTREYLRLSIINGMLAKSKSFSSQAKSLRASEVNIALHTSVLDR